MSKGRRIQDLTGKRFHRWTVIKLDKTSTSVSKYWIVQCDCGTIQSVRGAHLRGDASKSCGCLITDILIERNWKHGGSHLRAHTSWYNMIVRCSDPSSSQYENYGGRGIKVCKRWLDFANFLADMGEAAPGLTIERLNVNRGYMPSNCVWATRKEQAKNKRASHFVTYKGERLNVSDWGERTGLGQAVINSRLRIGWSVSRALTEPLREPTSLTYKGKTKTLSEWTEYLGFGL